ncbi:MAG: hypothetical protein DWP92_08980 [Armatimonadetes bacterium]|nr:MAG: hypothetical protein DWP92_08980 [Armatimonadota bacterium]
MFTRLRWFLYGVVVSAVVAVMVVKRARAMKERLDAEGVGRVVASYAADIVEAFGRSLQRSADRGSQTVERPTPEGYVSRSPRR